ncbi:MAG: MBL fold metallo-hydrolase [Chthoniobacterales bacterium]
MKPATAELLVRFWGVRGSIPSPGPETVRYGGNTPCVELRIGDELVILDAGSGIRRLGLALIRELEEKTLSTTLLISHTHWDHIQGLPFFRPAYLPASRLRIFGAPGTRSRLRSALGSQMDPNQFPVSLQCLSGICAIDEFAAKATTIGSFSVGTMGLNHPGGCTGFRISAAGTSIAYLPDHESYRGAINSSDPAVATTARRAEADLVRFLEGCDLLILDSQYDRTEYPAHIGWGHGCLDDSVALALRAGVASLALFHHDPNHDDAQIDAMLEQARRQVVEVGSSLRVWAACERAKIVPASRQKRLAAA